MYYSYSAHCEFFCSVLKLRFEITSLTIGNCIRFPCLYFVNFIERVTLLFPFRLVANHCSVVFLIKILD